MITETSKTAPAVDKAVRPMTGAEYLESLRDGREIWLYGERVKDVTTHPGFRNTARMIARLYDALHDPKFKGRQDISIDTIHKNVQVHLRDITEDKKTQN